MKSSLTRGYAAALVAAVFLSTTAIFIRYLTQTYQLPALVLAFWRDLFVALTLQLAFATRPRLLRVTRDQLKYLAIYGLMLACFNALWTLSVALNGAAVATVLVYCSTAFTVLLGRIFLNEHFTWARLLAVALALLGCALVSGALNPAAFFASFTGFITGVLAGLWYAIYSLMGRSASQRGLNPWTTLFYTFGFAAVFLFIANLVPGGWMPGSGDILWLGTAWGGWGVLFLLAAIPTVAGFGLYNVSLSYLPSGVANLIVTLEPVFTAITAYLLLGEVLGSIQIAGSALILAGVAVLRIFEGKQESIQTEVKEPIPRPLP